MAENNLTVITPNALRPTPILPNDYDSAWRMATAISRSGLAPRGITTTEAIFTAMQLGAEVGLTPMAALQNIAVVNGRPTIWGDAQLALVRASGLLRDFSEAYEGEPGTDDFKAVCTAGRLGETGLIVNEFSIGDAKVAGLWGKDGPWRTNPKRMLKMRARAFTLRDGFTDILKGISAREEMEGVQQIRGDAGVEALNAEFIAVDTKEGLQAEADACGSDFIPLTDVKQDDLTPPDFLNAAKKQQDCQEIVAKLYEMLKAKKKQERPAAFLEADGLAVIEKAGRNPTVDKMFTDIGIILP